MQAKPITFVVNIEFRRVTDKEQPPPTYVHAFDSKGQLLATGPVEKNQAKLLLPPECEGRTVRLFLSPGLEKGRKATLSSVSRVRAYEKRLRVDLKNLKADLVILDDLWKYWLLCPCVVRGRLVKRLTLPDGTIQELPICNARVTICEVDPIPVIIWRLPDDSLFRLRDELLVRIRNPIPVPPLPPEPDPGPFPGPRPGPDPSPEARTSLDRIRLARPQFSAPAEALPARELNLGSGELQGRIRAISGTMSTLELRRELVNLSDLIRIYLCGWPWLDPFFLYRVDCIKTVQVDENGRFETTIYYPCFGDKPDLYFKAEQWRGWAWPYGPLWETIYEPPVRCNTYWNYQCGTEVTINVTDPSAIPCVPEDPVDVPTGVTTWVMPFAVGGTKLWGTPPGNPPAPGGWVKSDGLTDYGGFTNAPFGGRLGFRHGHSNNIPNGIKYYRWSYRKVGTLGRSQMFEEVVRHYVKQSPGLLPTFPIYSLGPNTVGPNGNLFEFKPATPPGPGPTDPPGTTTYWPTDDFFADIYSGFLTTAALPPDIPGAAGQYQLKLEVFDAAGNQVMPSAGTFTFIVPTGVTNGTVQARQAQASEIDNGGFVFNLHVDNNQCSAFIDPPNIGGTSQADECGFLRYIPGQTTPVTIAFHAQHPNNFAEFNFRIFRGANVLPAADAINQEVATLSAGPYTGDGVGNFVNDFDRSVLLGSCTNAAFAERVHVFAKATTGWSQRISSYDADDTRAFALAQGGPQPGGTP
jgi:hypothetical protein